MEQDREVLEPKRPLSPLSSIRIGIKPISLLSRLRSITLASLITLVALSGIIALSLMLRLNEVNWDDSNHIHPDERFLTMVATDTKLPNSLGQYFDSSASPLNPYNSKHKSFVYGTFPLFLVKAVGELLDKGDYGHINLVGRVISALFDTGTVFLAFLIASRLYGRRVGLLAALLLALTVINIQGAHYFTVDSFLTFF